MAEMKRETPTKDRPFLNPDYPHLKIKEKSIESPELLQSRIDEYFEELKNNTKEVMSASGAIKLIADPLTPTVEHLSSWLGFKSYKTFYNYGNKEGYEEYFEVIEAAISKILGRKTLALVNGKGSTAGLIFDLVNNHGYKNKSEVESDNKNETTIKVVYE